MITPPADKPTTEIRVSTEPVADKDVTLADFMIQAAKTKLSAEANMKKTSELDTAITSAIDTGRLRIKRPAPQGLK
jgi:hypothetical protein